MDSRSVVRNLLALSAAAFVAAGCGNGPDTVMKHSADEQKAIDAVNNMTPQQQIDMVNKGPMPAAAKQISIQRIKDKYHLQ